MLNSTTELFLSHYMLCEAMTGRFLKNKKELFSRLAQTFFIEEEEEERLYSIVSSEEVSRIKTADDFLLRSRLNKYFAVIEGRRKVLPEDYEEVIGIRGNVLVSLEKTVFANANAARHEVHAALTDSANSGSVAALTVCGTLMYNGIFFEENKAEGLKYLSRAADWLYVPALLALIAYSRPERDYNLARLRLAAEGTPFSSLSGVACDLGCGGEAPEGAVLVAKAFSSGMAKRGQYDSKLARTVYSHVLGGRDKERLVYSNAKDLIAAVGNLPLKFGRAEFPAHVSPLKLSPAFCRKEEKEVSRALSAVLEAGGECPSLLLSCDGAYLAEAYSAAVADCLAGVHVERIEASALSSYDAEPSRGNIFVRTADEDKPNCYIITVRGEVPGGILSAVADFADPVKRSRFHLADLGVTLNLGRAAVVVIADSRNEDPFRACCRRVEISPMTDGECRAVFGGMAEEFGAGVRLSDDALSRLADCTSSVSRRAIEAAVRGAERSGGVTVTAHMLEQYISSSNFTNAIGFGGNAK